MSKTLDPITLEVLRHRLLIVNDEMGRIASQLSGSPVVYEAKDFNAALLTPAGDSLFIGIYMSRLSLCLNTTVKTIIERFADSVGFEDGDAFVTNDPWAGAVHQNDILMVAPIFHQGTLVCWAGLAMHEVDVGGPNPGSFTVGTPDVFGEGPLLPPVKMVERGRIREDIEALIVRNSRTSGLNALNLRARMAAIHRTRLRIGEIIDQYGLDVFLEAQSRILETVGASFARRLKSIPDGEWRSDGFLDHDGNENRLYRLKLKLTKRGERLTFDFTGTDPQARGAVNCTRVGLESGVLSAVLPMLCYDMSWSPGGVMPYIDIVSEEGTINNARHPAAVSMATVSATFATSHVSSGAIGKMLACSDLREEIQANWSPSWQGTTLGGRFDDGRPVTAVLLDETGGGGGRSWKDGPDTGGLPGTPAMAIANVETYEKEYPILYVYRRQSPDTGGPGTFRGGVGTEGMIVPHRAGGVLDLTTISHGASHPEAQGLFGGYPSSVQVRLMIRDADVRKSFGEGRIPADSEAVNGRVDVLGAKARTTFGLDDAYLIVCAGGGGYGDPLRRDPALVVRDVAAGLVSAEAAERSYGVVVTVNADGVPVLDAAATDRARAAIRNVRLAGRDDAGRAGGAVPTGGRRIGNATVLVNGDGGRRLLCQSCGGGLSDESEDLKHSAARREVGIDALNPWNRYGKVGEMIAREFSCPHCGEMLAVEIRRKDDPVLLDTRLDDAV